MNWYQKKQLLKIAQNQDFNWKQEFLTKLQDILKNHKSKATMMAFLMMTIFPMIDGFAMDDAEKDQLKNDAMQVEQQLEQEVVEEPTVQNTQQKSTPEQIEQQKQSEENELIDNTMRMTKYFESGGETEGYPTVYKDSKGIPTIGHGFNLRRHDAREKIESLGLDYDKVLRGQQSLNKEQIDQLFRGDVVQSISDARQYLPNFDDHPPMVQKIISDMTFNMGLTRMNKFKGLRQALMNGDYQRAADEMKYSNADTKDKLSGYYKDTGRRAKQLVKAMEAIARGMQGK
jgi:GH24 family phage-related lysozyme (muramidase)